VRMMPNPYDGLPEYLEFFHERGEEDIESLTKKLVKVKENFMVGEDGSKLTIEDMAKVLGYMNNPEDSSDDEEWWVFGRDWVQNNRDLPYGASSDIHAFDMAEYINIIEQLLKAKEDDIIFSVDDGGDNDWSVDIRYNLSEAEDGNDFMLVKDFNIPELASRRMYLPQDLFEEVTIEEIQGLPRKVKLDLTMPYPLINWIKEQTSGEVGQRPVILIEPKAPEPDVQDLMKKLMEGKTLTTEELMRLQRFDSESEDSDFQKRIKKLRKDGKLSHSVYDEEEKVPTIWEGDWPGDEEPTGIVGKDRREKNWPPTQIMTWYDREGEEYTFWKVPKPSACVQCGDGMGGYVMKDPEGEMYYLCVECLNENELLWWAITGKKPDNPNNPLTKDLLAESEEDSLRVYRRMSWEQYFDALETGYLMPTEMRMKLDGFVSNKSWSISDRFNTSHNPLFDSPLAHLQEGVLPIFEIELLPEDNFIKYGGNVIVDVSSAIPVERVTPFSTSEEVSFFEAEDDEEEVPMGARIMSRVIDSAKWSDYLNQQMKLNEIKRKVKEIKQLEKELLMATLGFPQVFLR